LVPPTPAGTGELAMAVGIEEMNAYVGSAFIDVRTLFSARGLDPQRFGNLMMEQKSVNLPCEDPVTNGVNAAKPIIDRMRQDEIGRIEALIVGTESGLDFSKPVSTYIHDMLGLSSRCRTFEVKHACYGGTAALHAAAGMVLASPVPGTKALAIATDAAGVVAGMEYWEPSHGAGAVAMLVGSEPEVLELDAGASGCHSFEVMDTCRPRADAAVGDSDLSLLSYLRCLENSVDAYLDRVTGAVLPGTFDYFAFHTPFAGMVKGAFRTLLRKKTRLLPDQIEAEFDARVRPSLTYCARVGNTYSAALYLSLCALIGHADLSSSRRAGLFSYGSGCTSEFYSGVVSAEGARRLAAFALDAALDGRHRLDLADYELLSKLGQDAAFGVRDQRFEPSAYADVYAGAVAGRGLLVLDEIRDFHRTYRWS